MKTCGLFVLLLVLASTEIRAEDLVLFKASEAGDGAWTWGAARIKAKEGGVLRITENSPTNDAGDVLVSDSFPYMPGGKVLFDVGKVTAGNYTLQILCFKGGTYFHTAEPVSHIKSTNQHVFTLGTLGLPADTESIMFKVWVAGAELASIDVNELMFTDHVDLSGADLDDHFKTVERWTPDADKITFVAEEGAGARMTVKMGAGFGAVTMVDAISLQPGQEILFRVGLTDSCRVTLQLNVLDATGEFIEARDVIANVGSGMYGVRLDGQKWPDGASSIRPKIWISGKDDASALVERLIVFKR